MCKGVFFHVLICTNTSQYWTVLFLATMNKCTELRKYAFPDPCLLDFFFVSTTTSQNIPHMGAKGDLDFRISDLVKNPDGTDD